jgi:hypothetical protein
MPKRLMFLATLASIGLLSQGDYFSSFVFNLDGEPIFYDQPGADPVAKLGRELQAGRKLAKHPRYGYLPALLEALNVKTSTQGLVFSKTSFQLHRISPDNPRALYFNDDVYVGYVPGGDLLELSAVDPAKGGMFYVLAETENGALRVERRDECLQCHQAPRTLGVPGHIVRSVYPSPDGYPLTQTSSFTVDHRTPDHQAWGGWYVTAPGTTAHMGNRVAMKERDPEVLSQMPPLAESFDRTKYLSPDSDLLALRILAHQSMGHNYIARVQYETLTAIYQQSGINRMLGRPADFLGESSRGRIERGADILLRYLRFTEEPAWKAALAVDSKFAREFMATGKRDRRGRSLKDLNARTRLMQHRLSYLVYTDAFAALPPLVRQRFWEGFQRSLPPEEAALREILCDTLPDYRQRGYCDAAAAATR